MRSVALALIVLILSACGQEASSAAQPSAPPTRPPHVVLISIDTLRADRLGVYGARRPLSPQLDAFAQQAWLFERVHANSNSTGPSHMTMLTGVVPPVHGVRHDAALAVTPQLPTLAERLRAAGYATVAFTDGGYVLPAFGFDRGFDRFTAHLQSIEHKLADVQAWLAGAADTPTFLFLHTYAVHAPYLPDEAHDLFTDKSYAGPLAGRVPKLRAIRDKIQTAGFEDLGWLSEAFWQGRPDFDLDVDRRHLEDLYDGCVHEVDAAMGRLFGLLKDKGWLDQAWIIVTSDHGEAFHEHGTWQHRQLYEEELHVPLLIRPPGGLPAGRRVATRASLVDLVPTILARLQLAPSPWFQGTDLLADAVPEQRVIPSWGVEAPDMEAQVLGDLKRMRLGDAVNWFDLQADPLERTPLGAQPGSAALLQRVEELTRQETELRARLGEPVPAPPLDREAESTLRQLGYVR